MKKYLLLDADGVILNWRKGIHDFIHDFHSEIHPGEYFHYEHPSVEDWLGNDVSTEKLRSVIHDFHHTKGRFDKIEPFPEAKSVMETAKSDYGVDEIIVITSCGNDGTIAQLREDNLNECFPGLVDDLIVVDYFHPKPLDKFIPSVWVDDTVRNVDDGYKAGHTSLFMLKEQCEVKRPRLCAGTISNLNEIFKFL